MLEVAGVSFSYMGRRGPVPILNDVSFKVRKGGCYGIVGESGSGKSTLLRLLAGLEVPESGTIVIDGRSVTKWTRAMRRKVQFVMQDPYGSLHPMKTVNSVLAEPLKIHGLDRIYERIGKVLRDVGLGPEHRYRYPHQLSGGQRQRIAIARALVLEPSVVLLDEPTSALDVSIQAEILNLLKDLQESSGLTYILVSHDLAVIAHMCEEASILFSGAVVETLAAAALRAGHCEHPYSRELIASASVGVAALQEEPS